MAHRQPGKAQRDVLAGRGQRERGLALVVVAVDVQADLVRQQHQLFQQVEHFARAGTVVDGGVDLNRPRHPFQVGGQLGLEIGIQHGELLGMGKGRAWRRCAEAGRRGGRE